MQMETLATDIFDLTYGKECRFVQKTLSSAFHNTCHRRIASTLPTPLLQAWFIGRDEAFTSLPLNSSVRHVTYRRPPNDNVFPFVLSLRTLRPIFEGYRCQCGSMSDLTGLHMLRCGLADPSPFTRLHHAVRDATVKCMQDYIRRNRPATLCALSEADDFYKREVRRYHPITNGSDSGLRVDAIVHDPSRPDLPRFIDFVQAQVNNPSPDRILNELNAAHVRKFTALQACHSSLPRSNIVPFVFCANGLIHSSTLVFLDWFLRTAPSVALETAPSNEKLKNLHVISSAIAEKTASFLSVHFHRYISAHHTSLFPQFVHRISSSYSSATRRRTRHMPFLTPPHTLSDVTPPPNSALLPADCCDVFDPHSSQSSVEGLPLPFHPARRPLAAASCPPVQLSDPSGRRSVASVSRVVSTTVESSQPLRPGLRDRSNRVSVLEMWPGL
jgi:hypothetical protein